MDLYAALPTTWCATRSGGVPAIEHGDFRLYETQAILRYIDRVISSPAPSPREPRALARMDQLMNKQLACRAGWSPLVPQLSEFSVPKTTPT